MLRMNGVELEFTEDALRAIAQKSNDLKTGARGLRSIVENTMLDIMYVIPSDKSIKKVVISGDTIKNNLQPQIIREPQIA
jgi:ATP-dependent Clp protease ATP-binding subunit ClpX